VTRFFVAPDAIADGRVLFGADDSHHIAVVWKLRAGEQVVALPNDGSAHAAILETVAKSRCEARIVASARPQTEPRVSVTVAQALPKTLEKLEWVLQHGTEIGVARFVLFTGARSRAARIRATAKPLESLKLRLALGIDFAPVERPTLFLVAKNFISGARLGEFLLGLGFGALVGVIFLGQPAKGFFDIGGRRALGNTQN